MMLLKPIYTCDVTQKKSMRLLRAAFKVDVQVRFTA